MTLLMWCAFAAIEAPVTQVTVFGDQARVVRSAQVSVSGTARLEFPPLRDSADLASIKVEAQGAEVRQVDIDRVTPEALRTAEARKLLSQIDTIDTQLERLRLERVNLETQRGALQRLMPGMAPPQEKAPPQKLSPGDWTQAGQFASDKLLKVSELWRANQRVQFKLNEERSLLLERALKLGNPAQTSGWTVVAQLSGQGPATVTLSYLVSQARWSPVWDLQFQPETNAVNLSLSALVSQSTGEDWANSQLHFSTAVPASAVKLPELSAWKIGVADRFIPTPSKRWTPVLAPPPATEMLRAPSEEESLRQRLAQLSTDHREADERRPTDSGANYRYQLDRSAGKKDAAKQQTYSFGDGTVEGELSSPAPALAQQMSPSAPAPSEMVKVSSTTRAFQTVGATPGIRQETATQTFSLSPPPGWVAPDVAADHPFALAQGYDLSFTALQRETVISNGGTRRVPLWANQWPVTVERKIYPALTDDAYLVAELRNPSSQVLPGGLAQLYVGADPAGTAQLELVSPGESLTLPLGIDRALKPVRNVQLVESTQGVFSKEEVGTYTVTIELVNPYNSPVSVRVADQWPVTTQKDVETRLVEMKPVAIQDALKGALEWRLNIAPNQKQVFSFSYTVKRPRGWKLQQREVVR